MKLSNRSLVAGGIFLAALNALALPTDVDQPIKIEADRLDVDDAKGISVYRGDVKYSQGTMQLTADEVTLTATSARVFDKAVALGKPAHFKQQIDVNGGEVTGQAAKIQYYATTQQLVLEGAAHLSYCGDEFSGERIEYFVAKDLVKADKGGNGAAGRVQVILQPRSRQEAEPANAPCRRLKVSP